MKTTLKPLLAGHAWPRTYLISILDAALAAKENRFARQTSLSWLSSFPGDLPVTLIRASALFADGLFQQALPILNTLVQFDPEYGEAQMLLYRTCSKLDVDGDDDAHGCAIALGSISKKLHTKTPASQNWSLILAATREKLAQNDVINAEKNIQHILGTASHTPLSGITHMDILRKQETTPRISLQKLAEHYHKRWPDCLQFQLILAEILMGRGESERAVALLHRAAAQDVTGQVAARVWGPEHPYKNLWVDHLSAFISVQIPSSVSAFFGWNLLPSPDPSNAANGTGTVERPEGASSKTGVNKKSFVKLIKEKFSKRKAVPSTRSNKPEALTSVESELAKVKENQKRSNSDGRFPVYVVFSTQKGLQNKYGVETTNILDKQLRSLVTALRKRLDWGAILVYADEPASMAQYGLKPVPADDAWKLKLSLVDLDDSLGKRGARIGAVLIIGGPDVVPFHYLPNPTDDSDDDVPSDNPYATRDENYFVPEWPVGRLPGGSGKDPGLLISTLRAMTDRHASAKTETTNRLTALWLWIVDIFQSRRTNVKASFGYSAEVWKEVSSSIFKTIGDPRSLFTSPPDETQRKRLLPATRLGYFNLHGVPDSAEWFGQRDPRNGDDGPEYPTALHPDDVVNGGRAPQVIFSEACYGTNILKKSINDAMALKFLASGSQAVIGSTVISYGSVTPPLNAADLLGKAFWQHFKDGFPTGEALRRAKITLATEMHNRQGYLDGEDQKTLISFLLYGDPLAQEKDLLKRKLAKTLSKAIAPNEIKTVCDRVESPGTSEPIPKEVIANVKDIVEQYLPGMRGAQLCMSSEHGDCCCDGHICPTSQLGTKMRVARTPDRRVVTLSKQMVRAKNVHESFARLTLDKEGKVVKLTVSR